MTSRSSVPTEDQEQAWLMEWASYHHICKDHLIAIPNGGSRHPAEAAKLKRTGVKAGVSDLFLACPSIRIEPDRSEGYFTTEGGLYHVVIDSCGLWIELKRIKGGRISTIQNNWLELVGSVGYSTKVCYGWVEAKDCILEYLGEKK